VSCLMRCHSVEVGITHHQRSTKKNK
jgi:hypothetical protein